MAHILAIESDPERIVLLRRIAREKLNAHVIVAASARDAITSLNEKQPDVILTSSLMPPNEGQQLASHLRGAPALDYLPVLTIPPLVNTDEVEEHGLVSRILLRRSQAKPTYDLDAVTTRIREALDQSTANPMRHSDSLREARMRLLESEHTPEPDEETELTRALDADLLRYCGLSPHQDRAPRWERRDLPWLASIRLTWGAELRLLNMSNSGLLIESGIRMTLGNRTDFQIAGADDLEFVMAGRVVRSDVASVNSLGVKYVTAATFEKPFESIGPGGSLPPEFSYRRWPRR
jgi:CheY-like chemotaxis protein